MWKDICARIFPFWIILVRRLCSPKQQSTGMPALRFMKKSKDEPPAEPVEEQRWPGRGWDVMGGPPGFGGGKPQREARGACRFEPS